MPGLSFSESVPIIPRDFHSPASPSPPQNSRIDRVFQFTLLREFPIAHDCTSIPLGLSFGSISSSRVFKPREEERANKRPARSIAKNPLSIASSRMRSPPSSLIISPSNYPKTVDSRVLQTFDFQVVKLALYRGGFGPRRSGTASSSSPRFAVGFSFLKRWAETPEQRRANGRADVL